MYPVKIIFLTSCILMGYKRSMKKINYSKIAKQAGFSRQYLCNILAGRKKPSYKTAKSLSTVTQTDPIIWLEGTPDEIRQAISKEACHE